MPEEKEEKKATPFFVPANKEGKKKESFTFSDKIKNSKPAPSKSFANRPSSKIGSDGKPRQTLFERTKRDAPFFIAALVALLLLPFLYKYSGNVNEEPTMVTPGYEDSAFNPERSGFDGFAADPDGQIAQLAGRDSMSLILPYGAKSTDEEETDEEYDSRSAYMGEGSSASHSLDEQDEEENTTNIYKYRKKAPAATRAAFKRAATKIGRLGNAGRAGANGSKLGIGMWGGGMKTAANKVRGKAPESAPKPVSLQPLQAAGKPSRSYFGQGPAREAARSKDAMSKGNAMQALMDAQMKPVEPGKIGGILGGDFGGPGGGNGDLKREFAFSGKEPWWWDMMKQRSMMEWQKEFEYKWGWINWATDLAKNILGGVLNCLITGNDNGDMGHMFGAVAGSGKKDECCGMDEDKFKGAAPGVEFSEKACKGWVTAHPEVKCSTKWVSGHKASANLGFFGSRMDCLTNGLWAGRQAKRAGYGVVTEADDCTTFYQTGRYKAEVGGPKRTMFHYVVGIPFDKVEAFFKENNADKRREMLQIAYFGKGGSFAVDSTEAQQTINKTKFVPLFIETVAIKNRKLNKKTAGKNGYEFSEIEGGSEAFLTAGKESKIGMPYTEFLKRLSDGGVVVTTEPGATPIMSAKGSKEGKSWSTGARCAYPMAFISCRNNALSVNGQPQEGVIVGTPAAFIKLPNLTGKVGAARPSQAELDKLTPHFSVMYEIQGADQNAATGLSTSTNSATGRMYFANVHPSNAGYEDPSITNDHGITFQPNDGTYTVKVAGDALRELKQLRVGPDGENRAVITWTVRQNYDPDEPWAIAHAIADGHGGGNTVSGDKGAGGSGAKAPGQIVSQATCVYFDDDTEPAPLDPHSCSDGETRTNSEGCEEECKNNVWVKKDPDCPNRRIPDPVPPLPINSNPGPNPVPNAEQKVEFYRTFKSMTEDPLNDKDSGRPLLTRNTEPKKWNTCQIDNLSAVLLDYDQDSETQAYMKAATDAYTKAKADGKATKAMKPYGVSLEQGGQVSDKHPTLAQVVDAMRISQSLGITNVPKNTVCAMARTIGIASKDPHSPNMSNMFGAFAAYIDYDSSFFPTMRVTDTSSGVGIDRRFHGCYDRRRSNQQVLAQVGQRMQQDRVNQAGQGCGETRNGAAGKNECSAFHYGHYNWNEKTIGDLAPGSGCVDRSKKKCLQRDRIPYEQMIGLTRRNIWGKFPLRELSTKNGVKIFVREEGPVTSTQTRNGTIDSYNRKNYHKAYNKIFHVSGESCGYGSSDMMPVDKALEYIDNLCQNGITNKPSNGARIPCEHHYLADF